MTCPHCHETNAHTTDCINAYLTDAADEQSAAVETDHLPDCSHYCVGDCVDA